MLKNSLPVFFLTIFLVAEIVGQESDVRPQTRDRVQLQQAQRYQRNNRHDLAIRLLEPLYNANIGNRRYYEELLESYLYLSEIENAYKLIEIQQNNSNDKLRYDVDFARVIYRSGDRPRAFEIWNGIIDSNPKDVFTYTMVARSMMMNRLYDEAAEVYERAHKAFPEQDFLLNDLASLYRSQLRYADALHYYFEYAKRTPKNQALITREIMSFRLKPEQVDSLVAIVDQAQKENGDNTTIQTICAKFYQKHERYDRAIEIYRKLEDNSSRGNLLLGFARSVQQDSLFELAISAYEEIIDRFPSSPYLLQAYLGASQSQLALAHAHNDQDRATKAITIIHSVIEKYPTHSQVANLSLLEGDIYRDFFFDIDRAAQVYLQVADTFNKRSDIRDEAYLRAGACFIIRGQFSAAEEKLSLVRTKKKLARAQYMLAQIAYFDGRFDDANALLSELVMLQGAKSSETNNALKLQSLLTNKEQAAEALSLYAKAEWLFLQQNKVEAVSMLEKALDTKPPLAFRVVILLDAARWSAEIANYEEAITFCNSIISEDALQLYADEAIFLTATILEINLQKREEAFALYDRILVEFPHSQFVASARSRMQVIREQNPEIVP